MIEYLTLEEYGLLREVMGRFAELYSEKIKLMPKEEELMRSINLKLKNFVKV